MAASSAVLAGIAAADAICCARTGSRSAGESHDDAVRLLSGTLPKDRQSVAKTLGRLLSIKTPAQYGGKPLAASKATTAINQASQIVKAAESLIV